MDKTIPLYVEDIIISPRKVRIGEVVIRKREITIDEKINEDLVTERVTVKNTGKPTNDTRHIDFQASPLPAKDLN